MFRIIGIAAAALLALTACKKAETKPVSLAGAPEGAAGAERAMPNVPSGSTSNLTPASAFRLAFQGKTQRVEVESRGHHLFNFAPTGLIAVTDEITALISSGTNTRPCAGCKGILTIHYFRREAGQWALAGEWQDIVGGSAGGRPPTWRRRPDLGAGWIETSFRASSSVGNCTYADLIQLTEWGPEVRKEDIPLDFDGGGIRIEGRIGPGADGGVRVSYSGSMSSVADYALVNGYLYQQPGDPVVTC